MFQVGETIKVMMWLTEVSSNLTIYQNEIKYFSIPKTEIWARMQWDKTQNSLTLTRPKVIG